MCTAATYKTKDFYFGRTLDNDFSYDEEVAVTPRNLALSFRNMGRLESHYAMIGMAHVEGECALYYEAVNEKGLCMAGLNFVGNAYFREPQPGRDNVATFEFIPWILGQCATVAEAEELVGRINLTNEAFHEKLPPAQLHWIIADRSRTITVEAVKEGVMVYDNPAGVLANNPTFDQQLFQLNNYMHLTSREPENRFSSALDLRSYSRGMGALGLPGDLSSQSRFVRAAFVKLNSVSGDSEAESVGQFFNILGYVEQQRGCCRVGEGYEMTFYTSCCNADKGIFYYTTYGNRQITAVYMHHENLEAHNLIRYPLIAEEQIRIQN